MEKQDPLSDFLSLRDRINRLFEDSQSKTWKEKSSVWMPIVDIYETSDEFVVIAELPEVRESDVDIRIEGNILRISGKRKFYCEGRNYHQVERSYGSFSRSFVLPEIVDHDNIKASLNDGILKIILSKKAEFAKHIEIK
jgi:HSP20 family protein